MKFSEKIVRLRKTKGMTQEELALAVGVSRQAVYKWECGQSYPEVAKLLEIKLLFGISIDDLLDDNYEVAAPEKKKRKRTVKVVTELTAEPETVTEAEAIENDAEEAVTEAAEKEEAAVAESEPASAIEQTKKPEKKRGFFARLFGRR